VIEAEASGRRLPRKDWHDVRANPKDRVIFLIALEIHFVPLAGELATHGQALDDVAKALVITKKKFHRMTSRALWERS
jgi:hypothetical protein